jgi:hypothetical protein
LVLETGGCRLYEVGNLFYFVGPMFAAFAAGKGYRSACSLAECTAFLKANGAEDKGLYCQPDILPFKFLPFHNMKPAHKRIVWWLLFAVLAFVLSIAGQRIGSGILAVSGSLLFFLELCL